MKILVMLLVHFNTITNISYTDILEHINCKTALLERHYTYDNLDVTICSFKKGTLLFTRLNNEDVKCIAYINGKQTICPEPDEVY